ncbi:terpene synthase family protein [Thermoactinospora rubra]|uniref:terpene synthase family protein n=1 Tax=Thermoactinospora rubra TaxID=1088767 RepID=UPI000A11A2B0|nr:terpene synthase family protein [Thermoactinospora rubra]
MSALTAHARLGRMCAVGVECGRRLAGWARAHAAALPGAAFDGGMLTALGLVCATGSPHATVEDLETVSRAALWVFAVDHAVETTRPEPVIEDCLRAAAGGQPASPVAVMLADLRAGLAARPAFPGHAEAWQDQLERTLTAMARQQQWRAEQARLTLEDYLRAADSCGAALVNLSHWIATGDAWTLAHLEQARQAGDHVQRYLRLLNDLAGAEREERRGDANALRFGITREQLHEAMADLAARAEGLLAPIRAGSPATAAYLEHQMAFNTGFYAGSDYWGSS